MKDIHSLMVIGIHSAIAHASQIAEIGRIVERSEKGLQFPAITKMKQAKDWEQRQKVKHRRKKK